MSSVDLAAPRVGFVLIGRNEGERLVRCLRSVGRFNLPMVYVDSGSTDGSVALAIEFGCPVRQLEPSISFTASRARHEGICELLAGNPSLPMVMFVDGDCEVAPTWIEQALAFLDQHPRVGIVSGRNRERFPGRSVYNRLCDMEWNTTTGKVQSVGGIFVVRVEAYRAAGGFNSQIAAGEEPELCSRIRRLGWTIWRLPDEMSLHDAAMSHFGLWWCRQVRTGYGGFSVEWQFCTGDFRHILTSAAVWGGAFPLLLVGSCVMLLALFPSASPSAAVLGTGLSLWIAQCTRIAIHARRRGTSWRNAFEYGFFTMLSKVAIWGGMFLYLIRSPKQCQQNEHIHVQAPT